jgi:hypothetical protein
VHLLLMRSRHGVGCGRMRSLSILGNGGGSELLYSGALPLNWIEEYYQRLDRNRVKMIDKRRADLMASGVSLLGLDVG